IDVKAATQKGIIVVNSPEGNTVSAAEHTVAMMLSLLRHVPRADASMHEGKWNRKAFTGVELYKKTVGVVGLGKIGREVAARVRAFQARVLAYDPFITAEHARELDLEVADLNTVLREADILTVHTPLTRETRGLIGKEQIAMMKKGARLVNCARGGIIDEAALLDALNSGHVAGAALDVFTEEPPTDWALARHERVVATPHLGASTQEAQNNVAYDVAEQIRDILEGRPARAAVNIPSLPPEHLVLLEPYVYLGERMGSFLAQIIGGAIAAVEVTYAGEITKLRLEPLTWSVLKGILSVNQCETVNYVNAPLIAQERGISVRETRVQHSRDYVNAITVRVRTESETREAEGTIFGAREPRIVAVDGHRMDLHPVGHKLLTWQEDQPGVVGRIGTFLGEHNINIAEMQCGRDHPRGHALMVLSIDESVDAALLKKIQGQPGIVDARTVTL
ncbi:MAG: phosphoglycerate dehydrogenase, partial [Armatimonadetes bacterium]|nr:phosphoglycerate dehydrogenase [Armatimonadota bacterium]